MIYVLRAKPNQHTNDLIEKIKFLDLSLQKIDGNLREDFQINRNENAKTAMENRTELSNALKDLKLELSNTLSQSMKFFGDNFNNQVNSFNELLNEKFGQLENRQKDLIIQTNNKLEDIRKTVEEKLEKTLSERLGQSFETVGKQLIEVQKGLGEMQNLAQDVGGLKKVLSNVKMRGGIGEVQLAMLLEQVLAPEQYQANVKTKEGSSDLVEFAIKLPGRDEANSKITRSR